MPDIDEFSRMITEIADAAKSEQIIGAERVALSARLSWTKTLVTSLRESLYALERIKALQSEMRLKNLVIETSGLCTALEILSETVQRQHSTAEKDCKDFASAEKDYRDEH